MTTPADRLALPATNRTSVISVAIPMHDPATGERRTATATLGKEGNECSP